MWIIFTGNKERPIIKKIIYNREELIYIKLEENEWIEEFEVKGK